MKGFASTLKPGDRLVLRKPIRPGEGNSYPRHLMGQITEYKVLRVGDGMVVLDNGNFLGTQRRTCEQVDERLASGELSLVRALPDGAAEVTLDLRNRRA